MCFRKCKRVTGKGKGARCVVSLLALVIGMFLFPLGNAGTVNAQECPDPAPQTSGHHSFRRVGETFDIPITLADCQAISLTVRWANGRNNGSLLNLTFFDSDDRPLYTKQISAFLTGAFEFPLSSYEYHPYGLVAVTSVPAMVTIQAAYPFGSPASLSYTITRANRRPRRPQPKLRGIDSDLVTTLQTAPGRTVADTPAYIVTELPLAEPRELELHGRKKTVRSAFRLLLKGQYSAADVSSKIDLIWIDDAAIPVFRNGSNLGVLIYDEVVLKNDAEISVSNLEASRVQLLPERLRFQSNVQGPRSNATIDRGQESEPGDEGNVVVGIKNAGRVIGGRRQPLVQIQLRTNRPIPAGDSALQLQVGKRFFLDELSGDHTGRVLTLTVTPEMFADLKEGAAIVAFFNRPDRSGYADGEVWYFGRLNKSALQ